MPGGGLTDIWTRINADYTVGAAVSCREGLKDILDTDYADYTVRSGQGLKDAINATRKSHSFPMEGMFSFSSGEWGFFMVGPNEIISMPGYLEPITAHSRPAWMTSTNGSLSKHCR